MVNKTVTSAQGAQLRIELYKTGRTHREFDVYLENGTWPVDNELANLCDGGSSLYSDAEIVRVTPTYTIVKLKKV